MLYLKIDVTKVDKARLFKGAKGTYLDAVLFENRNGPDQFGNTHTIIQSVSAEERAAGVKGKTIGSGKPPKGIASAPTPVSAPDSKAEDKIDEVPF